MDMSKPIRVNAELEDRFTAIERELKELKLYLADLAMKYNQLVKKL